MRRLAKVVALAASTAVAANAFSGDVWGFTTFDCSDEIVVTYDTVEEACRDPWVTAYVDRDDGIFLDCKSCNDVDDDGDTGSGGGGGIIIPRICPAGQHFNAQGQCQADHECGDDEIGGGETPCQTCGEGEVPNEDKTACVTCEHAELPLTPGTCACDSPSVDDHAIQWLKDIPRDPWEEYESYICAGNLVLGPGPLTHSTNGQQDVCSVDMTLDILAAITLSIAVAHSHPYFDPKADYSGDNAVQCGSTTINSGREADIFNKVIGRQFSDADMGWSIPTYLVVPLRDEVKVYRPDTDSEESIWTR